MTAAGVGTRISRHINKPKSTLCVNGIPLIRKTVEMLISKGIEVAVVVGYMQESVRDALEGLDVKFYLNPFYRVTNSLASLWFARDFMDDDTIIVNADVFWGEDILDIVLSSDEEIVMIGDRSCARQGDYLFKLDEDKVVGYGKDIPEGDRDTEYAGIAKIRKTFVDTFKSNMHMLIKKEEYGLWWENILYNYCDTYPIHVKDVSDYFWAEIDYIDDYERIIDYVKTNNLNSKYKQIDQLGLQ